MDLRDEGHGCWGLCSTIRTAWTSGAEGLEGLEGQKVLRDPDWLEGQMAVDVLMFAQVLVWLIGCSIFVVHSCPGPRGSSDVPRGQALSYGSAHRGTRGS